VKGLREGSPGIPKAIDTSSTASLLQPDQLTVCSLGYDYILSSEFRWFQVHCHTRAQRETAFAGGVETLRSSAQLGERACADTACA
jgi:hypothetical protein